MEEMRILDKAINLIETHGWIRDDYGNPKKGFCVVGALEYEEAAFWDQARSAKDYVRRAIGTPNITIWNDQKCTGKDQALKALRDAKEIIRG